MIKGSAVVGRIMSRLVVTGATVFMILKVSVCWGRYFAPDIIRDHLVIYDKALRSTTLAPALWFSMGYSLVLILQSKIIPWPTDIPGLFTSVPPARSRRNKRHRYHRQSVASGLERFLRTHKIQVNCQDQRKIVPCLELTLPENAEAFQFGDCGVTIPFTLEQTVDVYYRKFKKPLPDPASRLLVSIEVLEERHLKEYFAVFKRRVLRFRNEAPSLIKRFANSEYAEYIEDSLFDKQNRVFYVYVKNKSFQSLGVLEDFSVYKAHSEKSHWTVLYQFARVHITSTSLSFFRNKIETFISTYYCTNAPDARRYHLERCRERNPKERCSLAKMS
ncbi:hypothetical protein PsorP6_005089 [Peronosclerospora sorghi]|uniref:Uncharacterized protein n=1 Tax=Peronosclerospora sorghi TaxID=230839 RepID=A0ACC0W3Y5_9STRA|nr:hypothetical protein PsorP6_005089 [Peronosclerospora sorghi]